MIFSEPSVPLPALFQRQPDLLFAIVDLGALDVAALDLAIAAEVSTGLKPRVSSLK